MGYNTQIILFNDALGTIEKHPDEFVTNLVRFIHQSTRGGTELIDFGVAGHMCGSILATEHADMHRVLVSQGNWLWEVKATGPTFERALNEKHMREELLTRAHVARDAANAVIRALTPRTCDMCGSTLRDEEVGMCFGCQAK